MTDTPAVEIGGLTKSFGATRVLGGIDLTVPRGSVFALLGPNGAGKTTTVRIAATLSAPDSGTVRVAGHDVRTERAQVRARISLTGQDVSVDAMLTGAENLRLVGRLRQLSARAARSRAAELLERFDLAGAADRRAGSYSGGMRRRLDLAAGLVTRPEVLFLDEPTTGLDPRSRQGVWDVVADLASSGVTILLTTQYLEEADRLADRIAVIDGGEVAAEGTAGELKHRVAGRRLDVTLATAGHYAEVLARLADRAVHRDAAARTVGVGVGGDAREVRAVLDEIDPDRTRVADFGVRTASLDDVFWALTGHRTAEQETADV